MTGPKRWPTACPPSSPRVAERSHDDAHQSVLLGTMFLGTSFLAHVSGALPSASGESVLSQIVVPSTVPVRCGTCSSFRPWASSSSPPRQASPTSRVSRRSWRRMATSPASSRTGASGWHSTRGSWPSPSSRSCSSLRSGAASSAHPAVCHRRLHRLHPLPGGHGPTLVCRAWPRLAAQRIPERAGRHDHGDRRRHLCDREVRPWAWIILLVVPILVALMVLVHRTYARGSVEMTVDPTWCWGPPVHRRRVVIPVFDVRWDVIQAVRFGRSMTDDITAVHVTTMSPPVSEFARSSSASCPASTSCSSNPRTGTWSTRSSGTSR